MNQSGCTGYSQQLSTEAPSKMVLYAECCPFCRIISQLYEFMIFLLIRNKVCNMQTNILDYGKGIMHHRFFSGSLFLLLRLPFPILQASFSSCLHCTDMCKKKTAVVLGGGNLSLKTGKSEYKKKEKRTDRYQIISKKIKPSGKLCILKCIVLSNHTYRAYSL